MKKYKCIEKGCNKEVSEKNRRCRSCSKKGKNNPHYIDGRCSKKYYCKNCNKKISFMIVLYKRGFCPKCGIKEHNRLISGINNPNYGKKGKQHPAYKHGSKSRCLDCHKNITYKSLRCNKCNGKLFKNMFKGKGNPNYKHGESNKPYPIEFNDKLKAQIRKRDNYKCQNCGIKQINYYRKLDIHHIDYNKKNCEKDNLITLCNHCNCIVNGKRDKWYNFFKRIIGGNNV